MLGFHLDEYESDFKMQTRQLNNYIEHIEKPMFRRVLSGSEVNLFRNNEIDLNQMMDNYH